LNSTEPANLKWTHYPPIMRGRKLDVKNGVLS
jgi:hypothetical protein